MNDTVRLFQEYSEKVGVTSLCDRDVSKAISFFQDHPDAPVSAMHDAWVNSAIQDGWTRGDRLRPAMKVHPDIVPYKDLNPVKKALYEVAKAVAPQISRE